MEIQDRKSKKRPTITYYQIPAARRSKCHDGIKVHEEHSDSDSNNNNRECLNWNVTKHQNTLKSDRRNQPTISKYKKNVSRNTADDMKYLDNNQNNVLSYESDDSTFEASRRHRQINVDLSSLKDVVHRHINVKVFSQKLQRQIRMNKYLSWHRPSELRILFKAYNNKECPKEVYLLTLKIVIKDVLRGRDVTMCAEFCSVLLKKDIDKEKGDRLCISTFLLALEDLVTDYENPSVDMEQWKKFVTFLGQLFFFTEKISICALYLLPLISYALDVIDFVS